MNEREKKIDLSFFRNVAVSLAVIALGAAWPLLKYGTPEIRTACLAGAGISYANVIAGFFAIDYAFDKSFTVFMKAVLGGMGVRMLVSAAALVVMISLLHLHVAALIISLMFFYVVNLTIEIVFLQKKMELRTESVHRTSP
ncbi:MAG TPA: hypothetical protein VK470_16650 [Bacteroidota bacterium]|nr:hypothetical protein [Bacteroidota bacterium]